MNVGNLWKFNCRENCICDCCTIVGQPTTFPRCFSSSDDLSLFLFSVSIFSSKDVRIVFHRTRQPTLCFFAVFFRWMDFFKTTVCGFLDKCQIYLHFFCTIFKLQCGWFALLLGQLFAQLLDCCLHNGLHCCLDCSLHCCWAVVRTIVCIVAGTKVCTIFLHCCWNCSFHNCLHCCWDNGCTVVVLQQRRASCQGKWHYKASPLPNCLPVHCYLLFIATSTLKDDTGLSFHLDISASHFKNSVSAGFSKYKM